MLKKFLNDESGATAIEYGLIAAFIGLMLIFAVPILRNSLNAVFNSLSTGLNNTSFSP